MSEQVTVRATRRYNGGGSLWRDGEERVVDRETAEYLVEEKGFAYVGDLAEVLVDRGTDDGICGAEQSDGSTCERPADECPYHGGE